MARAKVCLLNISAPQYDSKSRGKGWVANPHIYQAPCHVQACCKFGRATSLCSACVLAHLQHQELYRRRRTRSHTHHTSQSVLTSAAGMRQSCRSALLNACWPGHRRPRIQGSFVAGPSWASVAPATPGRLLSSFQGLLSMFCETVRPLLQPEVRSVRGPQMADAAKSRPNRVRMTE